jgi:hypothetical protein
MRLTAHFFVFILGIFISFPSLPFGQPKKPDPDGTGV